MQFRVKNGPLFFRPRLNKKIDLTGPRWRDVRFATTGRIDPQITPVKYASLVIGMNFTG